MNVTMEKMQLCPLQREAAMVHCQTNTLFYLPVRNILFRCCTEENFESKTPQRLYKIEACRREIFDPENIIGFNVWSENVVPIRDSQIPIELAQKIQKLVLDELAIETKYPAFDPVISQNIFFEILGKMSHEDMNNEEKFNALAKEMMPKEMYDDFNNKDKKNAEEDIKQKKYSLGPEFLQYAKEKLDIDVSRF